MKQLSSATRSQLANALREYTTNVHTQCNLLSTATDAERRAYIERVGTWWNTLLAPVYYEVVGETEHSFTVIGYYTDNQQPFIAFYEAPNAIQAKAQVAEDITVIAIFPGRQSVLSGN